MMGSIWLMNCPGGGLPKVREEIFARDPGACLLRCGDTGELPGLARSLSGDSVAAALQFDRAQTGACASTIGALADAGVRDILVFIEQADPGAIACCFHAGATEVITAGAAESAAVSVFGSETCMGRETRAGRWEDAPADDDSSSLTEFERELERRERDRAEGVGAPVAVARDAAPGDRPSNFGPDLGPEPEPTVETAGQPSDSAADSGSGASATDGTSAAPSPASRVSVASVSVPAPAESVSGPSAARAPLVTAISGRGGCGKTTLVASMAACAARAGLRAAVLDLDLMFGNLHDMLGVTSFKGFESVSEHAEGDRITESDIEGSAMLIGPGLTLWGPCREAERAELMTSSAEQLIDVLRGIADVIFVDTSVAWGDTAAMAVGACDRCLVVGSAGASAVSSTKRVIGLAQRMGVPTTRMTCVFNRVGARGCGEEQALEFEMGISLRSRARIPDGGDEVASMISFGHVDSLVAGSSAFAKSVRSLTGDMLRELGCPVNSWLLEGDRARGASAARTKFRVPWKQGAGEVR